MGFTPRGAVGHSGLEPGTETFMLFDPKSHIGRILIINTNDFYRKEGERKSPILEQKGEFKLQVLPAIALRRQNQSAPAPRLESGRPHWLDGRYCLTDNRSTRSAQALTITG